MIRPPRSALWLGLAGLACHGPGPSTSVPLPAEGQAAAPSAGPGGPGPLEPTLRIGLILGADSVTVSSPAGLRITDPVDGRRVLAVAPHDVLRLGAAAGGLGWSAPEPGVAGWGALEITAAEAGAPLFLDGRPYRGSAEVVAAGGETLDVRNVVRMEAYLLGVVPIEIGPRTEEEFAAVEAQAIAARTYAFANLGARRELGFDLYATVEDQAYGGMLAERPDAREAVRRTAGRILVYEGRPIRAYYHSTCGGRTAGVDEVLDRPAAPYLRSVSDRGPDGTDYCAISPRYRWTARLGPDELNGRVRKAIARYYGVDAAEIGRIDSLRVLSRTPSGRVAEVAFQGPDGEYVLSRLDIRVALADSAGRILYSTDFEFRPGPGGGVEIEGRGYGHGAGMCQWGAIGRARAGQSAEEILRHYYAGAAIENAYGPGGE